MKKYSREQHLQNNFVPNSRDSLFRISINKNLAQD